MNIHNDGMVGKVKPKCTSNSKLLKFKQRE